jgi:hypothetical protein
MNFGLRHLDGFHFQTLKQCVGIGHE